MSADEVKTEEPTPGVLLSREDYQKIGEAMQAYKEIETKYLTVLNSGRERARVRAALILSDVILFAALWLGFVGWETALACAGVAFAAQETFLALATAIRGIVGRA